MCPLINMFIHKCMLIFLYGYIMIVSLSGFRSSKYPTHRVDAVLDCHFHCRTIIVKKHIWLFPRNKIIWYVFLLNSKWNILQEEFEDTKGVIRIRKSKKKTTQWPKEKGQKNKQRSTKHTHKTKYRVRDRPFNLKGEVMVFCFVQKFFFGQNKN